MGRHCPAQPLGSLVRRAAAPPQPNKIPNLQLAGPSGPEDTGSEPGLKDITV